MSQFGEINLDKEDFVKEILRIYNKYGIINKNIWKLKSIYKDYSFDSCRCKFGNIKNRDREKEILLKQNNIRLFRIIYSDNILLKLKEILNTLD